MLTMENGIPLPKPWHRQFWPWFLISVPLSAVIGGLVTLFIAITNTDALVVDDYYKQGLAINRTLARDQQAMEFGLAAVVRFDPVGRKVHVQLQGDELALTHETLRMQLLHPTLADLDYSIILEKHGDGGYLGKLPTLATSNWHLLIESEPRDWRLAARVELPRETSVRLGHMR
ncbi:MAG: FixH family protein [Gammaproteobacteria bacterium]|nr:FixH family protein [Gammaproteobacteria bacterium]